MSEHRKEQAARLRRWAALLREKTEQGEGYRKALMHVVSAGPDGREIAGYCAYGLAEVAVKPADAPHEAIWELAEIRPNGEKVYMSLRGTSEHYPAPETLEELGLYPECNPFAMRELSRDEEDHSGRAAPDLALIPVDRLSRPEPLLQRGKGIEELDGRQYIHLATLSDAGQEYWLDIADFAERRAAELEETDR